MLRSTLGSRQQLQPVLAQGRLVSAADAVGGDQGAELAQQCPGVEEETDQVPVHRECLPAVEASSSDLLKFLRSCENKRQSIDFTILIVYS